MAQTPPEQTAIEQKAINLVKQERAAWEDATVFVTEKVAFQMRNLIRQLRKNYWSIFDKPKDPTTGREKTWVPLTESICDSIVKNIDLDQKDINFRAKKASAIGFTAIVRNVVKNALDKIFFGEYLDEMERTLAIDGTAVWKTVKDKESDCGFRLLPVDLLNFWIDPNARSIAETPAVIERAVMTVDEFRSMDGWSNTNAVVGSTDLASIEPRVRAMPGGQTKMVEVFERWGKMPKSLLTGDMDDDLEYVDGHIVVSNVDSAARCHLIEEVKGKTKKPYEEVWYSRVAGRWYGRGPAEKVLMLQAWLNTVVNIRINRSYVSQLGIFKIKRNAGVTPQMLSRLAVNGAVLVNDTSDIEQMAVQEASQASYQDEEVVKSWAQRVTSAFDVVTGEQLPSSTPATNAVIQSRTAQDSFSFVKEGIGMFLQRWLKRHALPLLVANLDSADVVRLSGEPDELRDFDERVVDQLVYQKLDEMTKAGQFVSADDVMKERDRALAQFASMGRDRFVEMKKKLDIDDYDVEIVITNEQVDKGVLAQNLLGVLQTVTQVQGTGIEPAAVVRQLFDLMGLDSSQLRMKQQISGGPATMQMQGQMSRMPSVQGQQQLVTGANVPGVLAGVSA